MEQSARASFCFDSMESRKLANGPQEYRVKDLLLMSWKLPAIG